MYVVRNVRLTDIKQTTCFLSPFSEGKIRYVRTRTVTPDENQNEVQYNGIGIDPHGHGRLLRQDSNLVRHLEDYRHSRAVRSECFPTDLNHL